jgi:hypothetical protein
METTNNATAPAQESNTATKVAGPNVADPNSNRTHRYDALSQVKAQAQQRAEEARSTVATNTAEAEGTQGTQATQAETVSSQETRENNSSFLEADISGELLNSSHKGINWNDTLSGLPEDVQKLVGNLRTDYTRKTQELATQRKALEQERKALLSSEFAQGLEETATRDIGEFDPFSNESVQAKIEQEVARRMQQMIEPLRNEYELHQRQQALQSFKNQHPDLTTYKTEIAELLMTDKSLSLERAYYIVKGKAKTEEAHRAQEELQSYKQAAREYGLKVGGGRRTAFSDKIPQSVKDKGAYEIYKWVSAQKRSK